MRRRRSGFSFVEILTAMTVVAILAGIAVPRIAYVITRFKAVAIIANMSVIRDAAVTYQQADSAAYPPTAAMGQIPPALKPLLGDNFPFVTTDYQLQYNNWSFPMMVGGAPSVINIIGITVQTSDALLGQSLLAQASAYPHFQWGNRYTFIVLGL